MPTLEERLRLVVDATTGSAESSFGRLTTSAEQSARASDTAGNAVANAADAVAQARAKEADAAGKLSVAQAKLDELRDKGNASASQLVAAEERVASAQRQVQIASANTATALERQTEEQDNATTSGEKAGRGAEKFREQLGDVRGMVVGLVAGVSLADWLSESVTGFLEGARGAGQLAISMNATVAQAGQLNTLAQSLGLEMNDLLEIQASFAQVLGANNGLLESFGAHMVENDNGTTNWALTLESALTELQKIPDATKRNQLGFQLFGEEGYKQLSRLLLSGVSVHDALEQIGTPFDEGDVKAAQRYDAAMMDLSRTGGAVSRELGGFLVPIITDLVGGFGDVVDILGEIPGPIGAAIALTIAYTLANGAAAESGGILAATQGALSGGWARITGAVAAATVGTGAFATTAGVATVAGRGLMTVLGGPVGIALLALGAGFALLNSAMGDNEERAEGVSKAQETLTTALKESNGVVTQSVRQQAALAAQQAGVLEIARKAGVEQGTVTMALLGNEDAYKRVQAALARYQEQHTQKVGDAQGNLSDRLDDDAKAAEGAQSSLEELRGSTKANADAQSELAGELGQTTDKTALQQAAMDALTAAIDSGATSGEGFTGVVKTAAEAQDAASSSQDRANAAIDAYRARTSEAVDAVLNLINAQYASEDSNFAFLSALDDAKSATDDAKTSVDEHRQAQVKLMEAALSAASAAADAAVENARAAGTVVDDVTEAKLRADAMLTDLRSKLDTPGLTKAARDEMQGLIDKLEDAKGRGDITAVLTLTGADRTTTQLEETTKDRDTTVTVESRGGPAVVAYLEKITTAERLAIIRVESRGGPAVDDYLGGLARERLAIIRVETRGGPAVEDYLNRLSRDRNATINASRGSGAGPVGSGLYGAPSLASVGAGSSRVMLGQVTLDLELTGTADRSQLSAASRGKATVAEIKAYERENGTGWRERR